MKTLYESLFDKDLASKAMIQGIVVDDVLWSNCVKSFKWFREKVLKQKDFLEKSVKQIVYNEDDCVIFIDPTYPGLTVVCPETIWYNYVCGALSDVITSGDFVKHERQHRRFNIYFYSFGKRRSADRWYNLEYVTDVPGYMPTTISDKAKKIIKSVEKE